MQTQYYCYGCSINKTGYPVIKVYVTDFPVVKVHVDELSSARIWQHEEFEDTKRVIRIRISKNRQHNDQKKKDKRTNNDLQNIHIKLKIEEQLCATLSANVNINYRLPKYTTVFVLLDISESK